MRVSVASLKKASLGGGARLCVALGTYFIMELLAPDEDDDEKFLGAEDADSDAEDEVRVSEECSRAASSARRFAQERTHQLPEFHLPFDEWCEASARKRERRKKQVASAGAKRSEAEGTRWLEAMMRITTQLRGLPNSGSFINQVNICDMLEAPASAHRKSMWGPPQFIKKRRVVSTP